MLLELAEEGRNKRDMFFMVVMFFMNFFEILKSERSDRLNFEVKEHGMRSLYQLIYYVNSLYCMVEKQVADY